jgi:hypothetical protein
MVGLSTLFPLRADAATNVCFAPWRLGDGMGVFCLGRLLHLLVDMLYRFREVPLQYQMYCIFCTEYDNSISEASSAAQNTS